MDSSISKNNILKDLLDLMGRDDLPAMEEVEVDAILQNGLPIALKTHLDIMLGGESERTRAWVAKDWADRAGYSPVQRSIEKKVFSLDERTIKALEAISEEDATDVEFCEATGERDTLGSGNDQRSLTDEVKEELILLGKSRVGVCGPDAEVSSSDVPVRAEHDDQETVGGGAEGASQDDRLHKVKDDPQVDPGAGSERP